MWEVWLSLAGPCAQTFGDACLDQPIVDWRIGAQEQFPTMEACFTDGVPRMLDWLAGQGFSAEDGWSLRLFCRPVAGA